MVFVIIITKMFAAFKLPRRLRSYGNKVQGAIKNSVLLTFKLLVT